MDIFGIGSMLLKELRQYRDGSRVTGRSSTLMDVVRDRDVVVFLHSKESQRVERILRSRGINIRAVTASPTNLGEVQHRICGYPPTVRIFFDHTWLEAFYGHVLSDAQAYLARVNAVSRYYKED